MMLVTGSHESVHFSVQTNQVRSIKPTRNPSGTLNTLQTEHHISNLNMFFAVIILGLLTIALSAYFLPTNALSSGTVPEGAEAQVLQRKEGNEGGDVKTKIPISVNYHLTRQCNYSCGSSHFTIKTHHFCFESEHSS